jgi:hypothetical protein
VHSRSGTEVGKRRYERPGDEAVNLQPP